MLLKDKQTGTLIKILEPEVLFDPFQPEVVGQEQAGEEEQDPAAFPKAQLVFLSNEPLPQCWLDANYREGKVS